MLRRMLSWVRTVFSWFCSIGRERKVPWCINRDSERKFSDEHFQANPIQVCKETISR
jgi:hypothetical protein